MVRRCGAWVDEEFPEDPYHHLSALVLNYGPSIIFALGLIAVVAFTSSRLGGKYHDMLVQCNKPDRGGVLELYSVRE